MNIFITVRMYLNICVLFMYTFKIYECTFVCMFDNYIYKPSIVKSYPLFIFTQILYIESNKLCPS